MATFPRPNGAFPRLSFGLSLLPPPDAQPQLHPRQSRRRRARRSPTRTSRSISTRCSALDGEVRETEDAGRRAAPPAQRDQRQLQERRARGAAGARRAGQGDRRARSRQLEAGLADRQAALDALLLRVPNIPWEGAPVGPDETFNIVVRREGEPPGFDFEPLDHVALVEKNDWADLARITQVAGSRTYCLKGRLALLEQALMLWAQQRLAEDGFTLMTVPALARPQAFVATGHFPGHEEEAYHIAGRRALSRRHRRDRADQPPFGRDHRGRQAADPLCRLFALLPPRGGQRRARRARAAARPPILQARAICDLPRRCRGERALAPAPARQCRGACCKELEIPYQVIETSTGDMGVGKFRMNDIESLGAVARQISRDPQLLDPARLAGAARQPALARRGAQGALRPHAQQYRAGLARASSCRCSRTTRPRTAGCGCPTALQALMGGEYL